MISLRYRRKKESTDFQYPQETLFRANSGCGIVKEAIEVVHEEVLDNDAGEEFAVDEQGVQRDLHENDNENSAYSQTYTSPNGTRHWLPNVAQEHKPIVGTIYLTLEDAELMYKLYADKAGFDTRLSTIKRNKGAITNSINYKVTDCQARVRLRAVKGTPSFELYEFVESHNHGLVANENKDLTRSRSQLDFSDHELIHRVSLVNIGATRAYRIQSALKGGHHMVRGTKIEYTNSSRNVRAFIGDKDAQMVINSMNERLRNLHNYSFVYTVVKGELQSLFWADDVAKCNYSVSKERLRNGELCRSIHKLVWNVFIDPPTFERKWGLLMTEFKLNDHDWLKQMYAIREQWVPGYFKDIPMCCLMKTTSRCESSNASLKVNSSPSNKLVQFMLCFELSMGIPEVVGDSKVYLIHHKDKRSGLVGFYQLTDTTVSCSCMLYTRIGYLCRHVFSVFRMENIDKIPDHYISKHWDTYALPNIVYSIENRIGVGKSEKSRIWIEVIDDVQKCLDHLRDQDERLNVFATKIKELKNEIFEEFPHNPNHRNKKAMIQYLLQQSQPEEDCVTAPTGIKNEGSGRRRLISAREKAA
ncbi:protein FAR1-RELATED SEQUENCE 5-like [Bidens hawaiensis]|uniref:protein FAR1-RELATED SEQUENCE 5-like n=1 Tax=Bidens hawaiensis TaxID=980011 RepID=UPI0040491AF4